MTHQQTPKPDRAAEILEHALTLREGERAEFLNSACGDDASLRSEVESLLKAHEEQGEFLSNPSHGGAAVAEDAAVNAVTADRASSSESVGTLIGRYKLLQLIGEGGFGAVYMAEQREPVVRKVALKIIKLGMDTKQVIARFEAERQALAMMDHPNIAKVLDAGATSGGRPYFVMELVRGEPITQYCDKNNLTVEQRLELFQQVCHAVQHAHQKGIIHRDIKPSNVMITLHDGKPIPKVIDFGIAKATNARLTEKTVFTEYRQFIGTPEYMSPEQAEMSGIDIDTRSDVYSLGVLLYELLTGTTPFDSKKLRSAGYGEIQRIIREETPHKPSTRLSTLDTLPSIAAHRHTEPKKLGTMIRGDLDWIVMKALEKDRTRRYETANGFAMDIERHLNHQPVVAGRPSFAYRVKKFCLRNKAAAIAGSAVAAAILIGLGISSIGLVQARFANDRLSEAVVSEKAARVDAEVAEALAEGRAAELAEALLATEKARLAAETAEAEAERIAYPAALGAAWAAIESNDAVTALRFLDQAPEAHRGLEWQLLRSEADRSIETMGEPSVNWVITAFSADGTLMAQQDMGTATITISNLRTKDHIQTLRAQGGGRRNVGMTFSPDNRWLAVQYEATEFADIFDLTRGDRVVPAGSSWAWREATYFMAFSPDSTRCIVRGKVAGDSASRIRVWQLDPWKELGPLESHWSGHISHTIAWTPDGEWLVMGADGAQPMRIFDAESFELKHEIEFTGSSRAGAIVFSDDGSRCATLDVGTGMLRCYDTFRWTLLWESNEVASSGKSFLSLAGKLRFIPRFSGVGNYGDPADDQWLGVIDHDGAVNVVDPSDGMLRGAWRGEGSGGIAVGADAELGRVYSAHQNGIIKVWDVGRAFRIRVSLAAATGSLAFLSGGRGLIVANSGSPRAGSIAAIRVDPLTGRAIGNDRFTPISTSHTSSMRAVAESPNGMRLALVDGNGFGAGRLRVIDQSTGLALYTSGNGAWGDSTDVAWSPNGKFIAICGNGGGPVLIDAATYERIARLDGVTPANANRPRRLVTRCLFSADGRRIIACDWGGAVRAWNADDLQPAWTFSADPPIELEAMAQSPAGETIAVGTADGSVIIISAADGSQQHRFDVHGDRITDLAFTPDGSRLLTASLDGTLRFINTGDWRELLGLPVAQAILALAVSEDGRTIAVRGPQEIHILDVRPETELAAERKAAAQDYAVAKALVDQIGKSEDDPTALRNRALASESLNGQLRRQIEIVLSERIAREFDEAYNLATLQDLADADCALFVLLNYSAATSNWGSMNLSALADQLSADSDLSPAQRQALSGYVRAFRGFGFGGTLAWYNDLPWEIIRQPDRPTRHYETAIEPLRQLLQSQPELWSAHTNLALGLVRLGRYAEAIEAAERSIELLRAQGEQSLEPRINLLLAHLGLGNIDAARSIYDQVRIDLEQPHDADEAYLFKQATTALMADNWPRQQSRARLDRLEAKASAENAGPLDMARYANELHNTPYVPLRDLDQALVWAQRAVDLSKQTDDPGIHYRLCDLLEVHQAREDDQRAARARDEILRVEEQQFIAAGDDSDRLSVLLRRYLSTHLDRGNEQCARRVFDLFHNRFGSSPIILNGAAWSMLTVQARTPLDPGYAMALAETACAVEEAGDGANLWMYLDTLALAQQSSDQLEKAVENQRRAVSLIPTGANPVTVTQMRYNLAWFSNTLGMAYTQGRRGTELSNDERQRLAESLFEQALEIQTALGGTKARQTLGEVTNLAMVYNKMGQHDKARVLLEKNLPIKREVLGPQDEFTHSAMSQLAIAYDGLGRHNDAVELAREHLQLHLDPAEMPYATAWTLHGAASHLLRSEEVYDELRDPQYAVELAQRAVALAEKTADPNLWQHLDTLSLAHHAAGDTATAIDILRRVLSIMPDNPLEGQCPNCTHTREDLAQRLAEYEAALAAADMTTEPETTND